eukprot:4307392-Pyramimonas_sp.AAC.1
MGPAVRLSPAQPCSSQVGFEKWSAARMVQQVPRGAARCQFAHFGSVARAPRGARAIPNLDSQVDGDAPIV